MAKKFLDFIQKSKTITNKDTAINDFIVYAFNKLQSMFEYTGLPETIPAKWFEYYLMSNGNCFVTKVDGDLYAFTGGLGGEYDAYYQPTIYTVSNPTLNTAIIKEHGNNNFKIGVDGVLVRNDTLMQGMLPIISKYGTLLVESDITTRLALINYRIHNLISASDDKTNESAKQYLTDIENGTLATIGENAFFDGVKVHESNTTNGYFSQLIEITQYIKASFYNEIGLNANYNLKREYISTSENSLADDILLPLVDDMLKERREGIEKINEMYDTEITVDFSSSWKANNTENEKEISNNESAITDDGNTPPDDGSTPPDDDNKGVQDE